MRATILQIPFGNSNKLFGTMYNIKRRTVFAMHCTFINETSMQLEITSTNFTSLEEILLGVFKRDATDYCTLQLLHIYL